MPYVEHFDRWAQAPLLMKQLYIRWHALSFYINKYMFIVEKKKKEKEKTGKKEIKVLNKFTIQK